MNKPLLKPRAQLAFETLHASTYLTAAALGTTTGYTLYNLPGPKTLTTLLAAMTAGYGIAHTTRRLLNRLLTPSLDRLWNAARPTPLHGQRIQLTTPIEAASTRHPAGATGTVHSSNLTNGRLTVHMDDGRTAFPHTSETQPVPTTPEQAR
ncbi:hypothetical protein [Streptomyces cylindrosporus]|uniref:Uncharacterized protein n=1 Tax=Streptomyces cylindrosporus TaxID=2927583 RepID=A0ABS9YQX8_9ACTN|nr:hypothetical protein [Streptomyces cylindrosporus]MCI3279116.1 hypothetical protein [Streptomyces cylindrosporus]